MKVVIPFEEVRKLAREHVKTKGLSPISMECDNVTINQDGDLVLHYVDKKTSVGMKLTSDKANDAQIPKT